MSAEPEYNINPDVRYRHLEVIDVPAIEAGCTEKWFNQTLTRVNDSVVRLGIVRGEFHWHKHDNDDEFFFVLEGSLLIDLEGRTIELTRHQGVTIPRGVRHRPRARKGRDAHGRDPGGRAHRRPGNASRLTRTGASPGSSPQITQIAQIHAGRRQRLCKRGDSASETILRRAGDSTASCVMRGASSASAA